MDLPENVRWAFESAVNVACLRTRRDQGCATCEGVRRVLHAIEANLLSHDFKISSLKPSRAVFAWFAKEKDTTPSGYRRVRQVEVGLFLLDHTDLDIPTVASLVGFRYARSFTTAFSKIMGYPPTEERSLWKAGQIEDATQPSGFMMSPIETKTEEGRRSKVPVARKVMVGGLPPRLVALFVGGLRNILTSESWGYLCDADDPMMVPVVSIRARNRPSGDVAEELVFLEEAARVTLEVFRRFDGEVSGVVRPILKQLHDHFLDPGYSLETLKNDLLVVDNGELSRFSRELGISAWQYVIEARMEVASRLFSSTLSIPVVAELVGYSDLPQFRRAFKKWTAGITPKEYQARVRELAGRVGASSAEFVHWRFLATLFEDGRERRNMWAIIHYLEKVYGLKPCRREAGAPPGGLRREDGDDWRELTEIPELVEAWTNQDMLSPDGKKLP